MNYTFKFFWTVFRLAKSLKRNPICTLHFNVMIVYFFTYVHCFKLNIFNSICNAHDTHDANSRRFWRRDIAVDSLLCFSNGPMHTASIFCCKFTDVTILSLYYTFNHVILCDSMLQLVETAVCFTICMIQHEFSILIYSLNPIFIKLSWIEDKQQQHCFSTEGKIIICIGYTLSIKVISSLVNLTLFIKIW